MTRTRHGAYTIANCENGECRWMMESGADTSHGTVMAAARRHANATRHTVAVDRTTFSTVGPDAPALEGDQAQ